VTGPGQLEILRNGEAQPVATGTTVADMVEAAFPLPAGIAVALNGEVVARSLWAHTVLRSGDRLEILSVAPGG